MTIPKIINQKNYSNTRYYSRYNFLISHYKTGIILDLGNLGGVFNEGKSNSFHQLLSTVAKNSTIHGFDLFKPKNIKKYSNQKQGDIEKGLPYEDNFFDTVYMGELIEHLSNFKLVLGEISRVLKKDGRFILDTPNPYSVFRIAKWLLQREENLGDPTHLIFFTPASLVATLEKHNFKVETMSEKLPKKYKYIPHNLIKGLGSHLLISAKKQKHTSDNSI